MAIQPKCDKCLSDITEFGGILLSPPDIYDRVHKMHLCVNCYNKLVVDFPKK